MKKCLATVFLALSLAGCSTLDSINPFASSGPKMAVLQPINASAQARVVWRESVGKTDVYAFVPAVSGSTVYAASKDGNLIRVDDGKLVWKVNAGQQLSGGVGADEKMVVVGAFVDEVVAVWT